MDMPSLGLAEKPDFREIDRPLLREKPVVLFYRDKMSARRSRRREARVSVKLVGRVVIASHAGLATGLELG